MLEAARRFAAAGIIPGGTRQNLDHVAPHVDFAPDISETERLLLADAQTSGGLLLALSPDAVSGLINALPGAAHIGKMSAPGEGRIQVE